jgi:hypothetical protein
VRIPNWTKWALVVAAAGLGAAALTLFEWSAPDHGERKMAVPAAPESHVPAGKPTIVGQEPAASANQQPAGPAIQAVVPSLLLPEATGSISAPGLTPADRARPPALAAVAPDGPYRLSVRREAGALVLAGSVPDAAAREEIAALARERFFQERIVDETRLANGAPPRFLSAARFALDQLSQLASGEAVIAGASLRLEGEALYAQLAEEVEGKVKRKPPAGFKGSAEIRIRETEAGERQ